MIPRLAQLILAVALASTGSLLLTSCGDSNAASAKPEKEWLPEEASMARHITMVHSFPIGPEPDANLRVWKEGEIIHAEFQPEILEKLGGERVLYVLGWSGNPHMSTRSDYLFFLDALHGMLAMSAPEWRHQE